MDIKPRNPRLLTNRDVNWDPFHCCGNEDLVFLKCPRCAHLMVFCYECDTLYPDLHDVTQQQPLRLTEITHRVVCPACLQPFDDFYFLRQPHVDKYLPTLEDIVSGGFAHLLSPERRRQLDASG
jgi:hypothetical protein